MQTPRLKFRQLPTALGISLMLGASAPLLAETELTVQNDGIALSAHVTNSTQDILATSIRIVGPGDFVFEKHIEDTGIEWIPDGGLPDGLYTWEARAITVKSDAEVRSIKPAQPLEIPADFAPEFQPTEAQQIPLERYFHDSDKSVIRKSGRIRMNNGVLEHLDDKKGDLLSSRSEPNALYRFVGFMLDWMIPSAHAQTTTEDIRIQKVTPSLYLDSTGSGEGEWRFWVGAGTGDIYLQDRGSSTIDEPVRIEKNAPSDSIWVRAHSSIPRIGIGTATPTRNLHISGNGPVIRLERTLGDNNWFVSNANAGRFQVHSGEHHNFECNGCTVTPFTIEEPDDNDLIRAFQDNALTIKAAGQVSIRNSEGGSADLHVGGGTVGLEEDTANSFFPGSITTDNNVQPFTIRVVGSTFGIEEGTPSIFTTPNRPFRITSGAPTNSLRIASNGNIGLGTAVPERSLQVVRNDSSARIDVTDTNEGAAFQNMFSLTNAGNPQFRMENTSTDKVWNFRTQDFDECSTNNTCFVINKRSGPRFRFMEDGDMFIEGAYENSSSRTLKHAIVALDPNQLFEQIQKIGVYEWSYDHSPESRHVGPMAEDFYQAFGLGSGEKSISPSNMAGISLAAAQALHERNLQLEERLSQLEARLGDTN